ncbi:WD domain, G-beta repeat [Polystyrenella longa]|uniref:WD domain, G-beta repeat n=1 Tax=Polystyrenella longa TaxID=2528007 RepID=A0A518CJ94_9PLAN|nr:WD40 repeat domain-containing protein [Polystyrenella longa]QDU79301.1 WD domain, G-beta repeat [Polystyrenella longa]
MSLILRFSLNSLLLLICLGLFGCTVEAESPDPPLSAKKTSDKETSDKVTPSNEGSPSEPTPLLDPVATSLRHKPIPAKAIKTVDISPDGKYLAAGNGEGRLFLWDLATQKLIANQKRHENWTFDIHFSPDSTQIATAGGDNLAFIQSLPDFSFSTQLAGHTDDLHGIRYFPLDSNRLVTGSDDTELRMWDLTKKTSKVLPGHTKQVTAIAVDPAGDLIASASRDKTIRLWNANTLEPTSVLEGHTADVLSVDFSPTVEGESPLLASASYDQTVRIWDVDTASTIKTFDKFQDWVFAAKFHPEGELLAIGVGNGELSIRDWKEDKVVYHKNFENDISSLDFSDDGNILAAATSGGTVLLLARKENEWGNLTELSLPEPPVSAETSVENQLTPLETHERLMQLYNGPDKPEWETNLGTLGKQQVGFPAEILDSFKSAELTTAQQELVERLQHKWTTAEQNLTAEQLIAQLPTRLERTAFCDLTCNFAEVIMAVSLRDSLRKFQDNEMVRQELVRLQTDFKPTPQDVIPEKAIQQRVQEYLNRALEPSEKPIEAKLH